MSFMVNKIVKNIDLDKVNDDLYYVGKERILMFQGVVLKVSLQKTAYDNIKAKKPVPQEESIEWVKKNIVGNIRKHELDDERMKETNALDMMQNSSIIYHTESILEMQLCLILAMFYLTDLWNV